MVRSDEQESQRHWSAPERWQVGLAAAALLVAIIAVVGQFVR